MDRKPKPNNKYPIDKNYEIYIRDGLEREIYGEKDLMGKRNHKFVWREMYAVEDLMERWKRCSLP